MQRMAALAAGVVATVTLVGWAGEAVADTPDPTLVARVPAEIAATCQSAPVDRIPGAVAAIECTPADVASVTYASFPNSGLADSYYEEFVGEDGRDTGSDCADAFDSESPFHTATGAQGRVTCSTGGRENSLTWIEDTTVATATDRDDIALYEWWDDLVGRSLTPAQQALMTKLPRGVSRDECNDNGENSVKCWPLDAEDVYGVYFTQYPDQASMDAAYAEVLADAHLRRNLDPPNTKGTTCTYETYWGPVRDGRVTKKLGRLACFEHDLDVDLVWTDKNTHVLTRVTGYSPKAVYRYFQHH
jgi:hypothetical protein